MSKKGKPQVVAEVEPTPESVEATTPDPAAPVASDGGEEERTITVFTDDPAPRADPVLVPSGIDKNLAAKLTEFGFTAGQIKMLHEKGGVVVASDIALLTTVDRIVANSGCTPVAASKALNFGIAAATPVSVATSSADSVPIYVAANVLPDVPDDGSLLGKFEMGATLLVTESVLFAAMRASLAYDPNGPNLADLPRRILKLMEDYAEGLDIAVDAPYMEIYREVTARRNADVATLLGIPGAFATQERKRELLARMNDLFWPELRSFHTRLEGWVKAWQAGSASLGMNINVLLQALANYRVGGVMPPGFTSNPETGVIEDSAKGFIRIANRTFSGVKPMTASALGYEATKLRTLIDRPGLAVSLGANGNRDLMLKMLGVSVSPDAVRMERDVVRYGLAVWRLPGVSSGEAMLRYLGSLFELGATIPWDSLPDRSGSAPRKEGRPGAGGGFRSS